MTTSSHPRVGAARYLRQPVLLLLGLCLAVVGFAAEAGRKNFNVPADDAAKALKQFAAQSGEQLLFSPSDVAGVKTLAIKGELTPRAALERMLEGTTLVVAQDKSTGALAVRKETAAEAKNALSRPADAPAANTADARSTKIKDGTVQLDTFEVKERRIDGLINKGILQAGADAPVYHSVIGRAEIERLGVTSVQELFRYIPQTTTAATSLQDVAGAIGNGQRFSTTSLRGFSSAQTVILVNGRPLPRTTAVGTGGPDLDRIPLAAIERVEIMPLAGSAIYGSGAVGGAINIILRKDYSGRDLITYVGTSTDGGGTEYRMTYVEGRNFNEGRTNLTFTLSYQHRDALRAAQRDHLDELLARYGPNTVVRNPYTGVSAFETFTIPAFASSAPIIAVAGTASSSVDLGVPGAPGLRWVQVPAGTTNDQSAALTPASFSATAGQFTPNPHLGRAVLYEPQDTMSVNAQVEHKFIPQTLEAYGEFTLGRNTRDYTRPETTSLSLTATDPLNPFRANVTPGFVGRPVTVYFSNPDIPDSHTWVRSDSARAVLGLKGDFSDKWSWSVDGAIDYAYTATTIRTPLTSVTTLLNLTPFSNAAPAAARRAVYNVLADHNRYPISAADADRYFGLTRWTHSRSVQQEYNARVTGELANLPAGPLRTSVAGKFRTLDLHTGFTQAQTNDHSLLLTGVAADLSNSNPTVASRDTWQAAVEVVVPVISPKWRPMPVEALDLNLSASTERFNAAGHNQSSQQDFGFSSKRGDTYVAAAKLQLTRDIAVRASYSLGVYPPDWNDLSDPIFSFSLPGFLPDPRRGNTVQADSWTLSNGGNPALVPEQATSQNIGLLFTPQSVSGLSLTLDYWRTKKTDAIIRNDFNSVLQNESDYAGAVQRAAPTAADTALGWAGVITQITTGPINISQLETDGVDFQGRYEFPSPVSGKITLRVDTSFTNHFLTRTLPSSQLVDTAGAGGPIRWRGFGAATWEGRRTSVTVTGRYVGHYSAATTRPTAAFPAATGYDGGRIPAFLHWDIQASYSFPNAMSDVRWRNWLSGTKITVGVLNVLNKKPTFVSDPQAGFYNRQDDPRQRFVYVSIKKSF